VLLAARTVGVNSTIVGVKTKWLSAPQQHDYAAAGSYLSLLESNAELVADVLQQLQASERKQFAAKDILRASQLPLLPPENPHVAADLRKINKKEAISPVLLVTGHPLTVADGYHRVCAAWHIDEDAQVPCHIAAWKQTTRPEE
jgi:hypothetical protein